ncbi:Hypothetical predicted protein [Pelobates cultripes]|uniref:Uncharacterized protein n=1 Tax=Pelobates cultripes TaxID=61616 RepID=A0AAD1RGF4_PELCU|nr:Hypothetical predicted protein [Pelobates cultripes]
MKIKQQELFKQLKPSDKMNQTLNDAEMKTRVKDQENLERVSNKVIVIQEILQSVQLKNKTTMEELRSIEELTMMANTTPTTYMSIWTHWILEMAKEEFQLELRPNTNGHHDTDR